MNSVMDLLFDISSRLSANEQVVEQMKTDKASEEVRRVWSPPIPFTCHPLH